MQYIAIYFDIFSMLSYNVIFMLLNQFRTFDFCIMTKLLVAFNDHCPRRVTLSGGPAMKKLMDKHRKYAFVDTIKKLPFKQFFICFLYHSSISCH